MEWAAPTLFLSRADALGFRSPLGQIFIEQSRLLVAAPDPTAAVYSCAFTGVEDAGLAWGDALLWG